VYFVRREGGPAYGGKTIEAVRRGKWKLLQDSPFGPQELYDLDADPLELDNLWDDAAHLPTRTRLQEMLLDVLVATEDRSQVRECWW